MTIAKRSRLGIRLQVAKAAGALIFGLKAAGEEVRSETGIAPSEAPQLVNAKPLGAFRHSWIIDRLDIDAEALQETH